MSSSCNQNGDETPMLENELGSANHVVIDMNGCGLASAANPNVVIGYGPTSSHCVLLGREMNSTSPTNEKTNLYNKIVCGVYCVCFCIIIVGPWVIGNIGKHN